MASVLIQIRAKVKSFGGHDLILAADLRPLLVGRSDFFHKIRRDSELEKRHSLQEGIHFFWVQEGKDGILEAIPEGKNKKNHPKRLMGLKISYLTETLVLVSDEEFASAFAPPALVLSEEEKFRDSAGIVIEIEACGEKTLDGIYFQATTTGKLLGVDNVGSWIGKKESSFVVNTHYRQFRCPSGGFVNYLTFLGLLQLFFNSKKPTALSYCLWIANIIFTAQLGTKEEKQDLSAKLLGLPISVVRQFTSEEFSGGLSGVYLFQVGTVGQLRESWNLPAEWKDEWIICKYGEHKMKFDKVLGKRKKGDSGLSETIDVAYVIADEQLGIDLEKLATFPDVDEIRLRYFAQVDATYQVQAENELRSYFGGKKVEFQGMRELVVLSEDGIVKAKGYYDEVKTKYAGCMAQLQTTVKELQAKCENLEKLNAKDEDTLKDLRSQIENLLHECKEERRRWDAERVRLEAERSRWEAERGRLEGTISELRRSLEEKEAKFEKTLGEKDRRYDELAAEKRKVEDRLWSFIMGGGHGGGNKPAQVP